MIRRRRCALLFLVLTLCTWPRTAAAQAAKPLEIAGGYAYVRDEINNINFPAGWAVGIAARAHGWFSIVGDVSGNYKTLAVTGSDVRLSELTWMAGGRASARLGVFVEFGQFLVGIVHTSGTAFGSTSTDNHFAIQPGAGLDYPLGRRFAARAEIDGRFVNPVRQLRFVAGIVYTVR